MSTLLKLKKINLKYQTGEDNIRVLKNIDLNIKKKETVSVVGESGSGKTSLIMLVGGLEKPCLLYTSPSPRDVEESRMPSSA